MSLKGAARRVLDGLLSRYDYQIVLRSLLYEWQRADREGPRPGASLPPEAESYLTPDNPRLRELAEAYSAMPAAVTRPLVWTEGLLAELDLKRFRGESPFLWQTRLRHGELHYVLATYYGKTMDSPALLERLEEDGLFGALTFVVDGRLVSRDLLDSIVELCFLEKHLRLSSWRNPILLDIGAGYGRLAHRAVGGFENIGEFLCTDAVPSSTFLCEYYLRYRKVNYKAKAVPLCDLAATLRSRRPDIAINIHSWSECTLDAIGWWLDVLAANEIRYLMVVPNPVDHGGTRLTNNVGQDFSGLVTKAGYRLVAKEPKYRDPAVQRYGLFPTYYWLFELSQEAASTAATARTST
ncbi:MAG TPA: hypothetical protein VM238_01890 [Phycisphaerae bacterium]|nr:hypothetical protein [Phycisphaerae bacterium]